MDNDNSKQKSKYLEKLLSYYEDEIVGEAYFYGLVEHFDEKEKLVLLARVERHAAESVVPLLEKYSLVPRDDCELKTLGESYVKHQKSLDWTEFMKRIVKHYPDYLDDFSGLEKMAPEDDLYALNVLTEHEVAAIDFAKKELAGDPNSVTPLHQYLAINI